MGRTSDSRQRLMAAAHELISEYSYGAVTIEAICERAQVKKGSFYYFFTSKSDLTIATVTAWWAERRTLLQRLFQPEMPPLERIGRYIDHVVGVQLQVHEETGQILGCPVFTLGSEICNQDKRIQSLLLEILSTFARYFEEAIRDAQASGEIENGDSSLRARLLWGFYEGTLTRARIENNVELLHTLSADALQLLGARPRMAAMA